MDATQTILIVETDMLVRHPLAEYLRECGYRVMEALDLAEAQLLLTADDVGIDIVLAGAGGSLDQGFDLANWIRQSRPDIEVILTGTLTRTVQKANELCEEGSAGAKPYGHNLVLDEIRRLLAARERGRQRTAS